MLDKEGDEERRASWIRFIMLFVIIGAIIGLAPDLMSYLTGLNLNNIQTCENITQGTNCMPASLARTLQNAVWLSRIVGALLAIGGGGIFAIKLQLGSTTKSYLQLILSLVKRVLRI